MHCTASSWRDIMEQEPCDFCNGTGEGRYDGSACKRCGGTGLTPQVPDPDGFDPPVDDFEPNNGDR